MSSSISLRVCRLYWSRDVQFSDPGAGRIILNMISNGIPSGIDLRTYPCSTDTVPENESNIHWAKVMENCLGFGYNQVDEG